MIPKYRHPRVAIRSKQARPYYFMDLLKNYPLVIKSLLGLLILWLIVKGARCICHPK